MPFFQVMVCAEGLNLKTCVVQTHVKSDDCSQQDVVDERPIIGFYATRLVWAKTHLKAAQRASKKIAAEWKRRRDISPNEISKITITEAETYQLSLIKGLCMILPRSPYISIPVHRFPTKGYTFFAEK